jgi:uncharacterized protein (TIGR00255 family)
MIKSMTAFARADKIEKELSVVIEIRAYNSKYLDVALRLPRQFSSLEEKVKSLISGRAARGRFELNFRITGGFDDVYAFEINEPKAVAYHKALVRLKERFDIDSAISIDLIAGQEGIIIPAEIEKDLDAYWSLIKQCMSEALDNLDAMRKREGDFIAGDIAGRLDYIEKSIDLIEKESCDLLSLYQERLKGRISVLTQGMVEIDPGRIVQEAAFLADRSDISEEIVRAKSHIKQFRIIMNAKEPAGRKLNFLLQEFNREFNTMASKAGNANVSHVIVDVKSELEKIREQVQNVE